MKQELTTPGRVMAALATLEGESEPGELFRFGPEELEQPLTHYAGVLKSRFARGRANELSELLRSWSEHSPALPIHEIHPGWILELVKQESPRVIGLMCRYLPGNHVRYLLENLPRSLRDKLPTLSESFGLPAELMRSVKDYLATQFFHGTPPNPNERFSCHHIPWMSVKDIRRVIRELGYQEIRSAFSGIDRKAVQAFLARFPLEEARVIRRHLESGPVVSAAKQQRAQEHIVSLNLSVSRAEDLPFEIGLSTLAEVVRAEEADWIEGVVVRLSPAEGYSLRRCVRDVMGRGLKGMAERRQAQLLSLIRELAERREIARYWRAQAEEETTKSEKGE